MMATGVKRKRSLTFRLTAFFALISSAILLGLGYLIGYSVDQHFVEQDIELLDGKMELARSALERVTTVAGLQALPAQLDESLVGHHGLDLIVVGPDGKVLFQSGDAEFPPSILASHNAAAPVEWESGARRLRGISGQAATGIAGAPPALVGVATDISHHQAFMASFRVTLWSFVVVAAALTGLFGWLATRRALAPLREIQNSAERITASRLNYRLSLEAIPIELAELAETLNAMLARLEESFRRLSDFSSDLAHELRTPVSNLMTQTQVALSKARDIAEYQDILSSNSEELERMARMISDMLFLAKADNGLIIPHAEDVVIEQEVKDLFEFYEALAEAASVRLHSDGSARVSGDRLMLRRALSNLLSNAIRHATPGTTVDVSIKCAGDFAQVMICNMGDTISPEHLPRIFDRFYRVDPSRQRTSDGAGLGLAITQSIVRAHGGDMAATSAAGQTCFSIALPAEPIHHEI